jgi:hypothetical protein
MTAKRRKLKNEEKKTEEQASESLCCDDDNIRDVIPNDTTIVQAEEQIDTSNATPISKVL